MRKLKGMDFKTWIHDVGQALFLITYRFENVFLMDVQDYLWKMMTIRFNAYGDSLGTRQLGAKIRNEIEALLSKNDKVVFDFEGVNVIANSFADECFGKLVLMNDFNSLKNKISFTNANAFNKTVIINAFRQRTEAC